MMAHNDHTRDNEDNGPTVSKVTAMASALEIGALPKIPSPEAVPHPIHRLPEDIFVLIPCFFESENGARNRFPMNKPLISMTHVCHSWRNALLSTPSLWTQINFSISESKLAECFLARSGQDQLLDVYHFIDTADDMEPFLQVMLCNIHRIRRLEIDCYHEHIQDTLAQLTKPAPELTHLKISNGINIREDTGFTVGDTKLPNTIFGGRYPKLAALSLQYVFLDLHNINLPSLTRFSFTTGVSVSVQDLKSFFRRYPSLEFVEIHLSDIPRQSVPPPEDRVRLAVLKELRLGPATCINGLINHLTLPMCSEVILDGVFTGKEFDTFGPTAQILPSSIDHLPVTRGITKAVAMPASCILSGPNGNLKFSCPGARRKFDAEFFTSFSPISALDIKELWVGQKTTRPYTETRVWNPTAAEISGAFGVLTKVEDLTIVGGKIGPFFSALVAAADDRVPLPRLRKLTVFVGKYPFVVSVLIQCAKTRKKHSRPLGEVTIVVEKSKAEFAEGAVESLKEFVGESKYRVGTIPRLSWVGKNREPW